MLELLLLLIVFQGGCSSVPGQVLHLPDAQHQPLLVAQPVEPRVLAGLNERVN